MALRWLERGAIVLVSLAIAIGVIVLLSGGIAGTHDDPGVAQGSAPGVAFADDGDRHLAPGARDPVYSSQPPTSGAHVPVSIDRQDLRITDDQLLQALELGDVVLLYPDPRPPAGLARLAASLAPPFTPALAQAGQAIILARRPGLVGDAALAWDHLQRGGPTAAPALAGFVRYWLGRGAPQHRPGSVAGTG